MARRPRVFAPGLLYHVIVRGNQRRKTFYIDDDYQAYLDRLEKYRAKCHVRIYAYCLMPNHVHLLVECVFRTKPAGHFGAFRPAVSLDSGHPFRSIPASPVGVKLMS